MVSVVRGVRRFAGARPSGTWLTMSGSRIDWNANKPEITARRRLIVADANPDALLRASKITV